jgi:hypothetical protein
VSSEVAVSPKAPASRKPQRAIQYAPPSPKVGPGRTPLYLQPFVFLLALPISLLLLALFALAEIPRMLFRARG